MSFVTSAPPSFSLRLRWAVSSLLSRLRDAVATVLLRALVHLAAGSNLLAHARRELPPEAGEVMQGETNRCLLQVLAVFALQGHSGFSASYATSALEKLMRYQPLGPLTGADDEWNEVGDGVYQNRRCSHVFKQADRFDGQAYDLDGRIFREPGGACYTNRDSMVPITFPYTPAREYVDVPART